jgi:hypothetical protein
LELGFLFFDLKDYLSFGCSLKEVEREKKEKKNGILEPVLLTSSISDVDMSYTYLDAVLMRIRSICWWIN